MDQFYPNDEQSRWRAMLPGGLISVAIHALLLVVCGLSFRGCASGPPVQAGGQDFREIGIAVMPNPSEEVSDAPADVLQDAVAEQPSDTVEETTANQTELNLPTEVPSVAELLNPSNRDSQSPSDRTSSESDIIGPGDPLPGLPAPGGLADLLPPRSRPGLGAAGSLTPGPGETTFMNIVGTGNSFVYVIDTSSSMGQSGRLALAKSQLIGSLRQLQPTQTFQVLFYNELTTQMKLRNRPREDLYPATAVHVHLASAEIDRVTPYSGTAHLTPILHALRLEPDVVYFLTDGDQPRLTKSELDQIRKANRADSQIHVVEIASGPRESRDVSWLQLLAQQSGGRYSRIQVN